MSLAEELLRHAIGLDSALRFTRLPQPTFPPHNIEEVDENTFRLVLAVAGYDKSEIDISEHKGFLQVRGVKSASKAETKYLYQGIAFREFERKWHLGEFIKVTNATMDNGLLVIELKREVPEKEQPKLISIS